MAYTILVDNQEYRGFTLLGTSPMRIAETSSTQFSDPFIADFAPDVASLLTGKPTGYWFSIQPGVDAQLLDKLKPAVLAACRRRRLSFLTTEAVDYPPLPQGLSAEHKQPAKRRKNHLRLVPK